MPIRWPLSEQSEAKLLAPGRRSWDGPSYDVFGPNLREVPQDLRRYITGVTGAVEIVNKFNCEVQ